jgi:DNA-binding response OmpR family regulator
MATLLHRSNTAKRALPSRSSAPDQQPLVLIVEDHDDTRFLLQYLLEMRGCRVAMAEDGVMAVRVAWSEHPDLILMDASLPRLDGLAATRLIRGVAALNDIPIIFLSGHAHPAFRAVALETGGDDYLVKPFEIQQLDRVLEKHLGDKGAARAE